MPQMNPEKRSVVPVTSADLPYLGDFLHSSKLALPINRLLFKQWPNDAAQKPLYMATVKHAIETKSTVDLKVVDPDSGHIVGYLVLNRKQPETREQSVDEDNEAKKQNIPDFFQKDLFVTIMDGLAEIGREVEGIDHIELTYICVQPGSMRRGIGTQLVQECFDRAKAAGLPLSLTSEPAAHDFFLSMGFRDRKYVDIDLARWGPAHSGYGIFRLTGMTWSP